jgi:hypothetical protein
MIIEGNSKDTKKDIKNQTLTSSSHRSEDESEEQRKIHEKGKQIAQCSRRPVTRENMKRGHPEVVRQFALHFDGIMTKVGNLEFEVSEASTASATEIPNTGERWFKSMILNETFSKDFLKPDYQKDNLSKGVPRSHLVEGFDKMLKIIQRYFTCEGRFNKIYKYHIRLLLHFMGKDSMNIPLYLLRSMENLSDRVEAKSMDVDTSVFHSGLIRMRVMEELKKRNISWEQFIISTNMQLDIASTPQSKM